MAIDPFEVLGLPPRFDLEAGVIQRAFLERSGRLHPDRAATAEERESLHAAAADLNQARQILADPEQRANALLARLGGPARDADRSLPDGFLAEMMDVRERIEEARASGDPARLEEWEDWGAARRSEHIRAVAALFEEHARSGDPAVLPRVRRVLNVWRYTERLLEHLASDAP